MSTVCPQTLKEYKEFKKEIRKYSHPYYEATPDGNLYLVSTDIL